MDSLFTAWNHRGFLKEVIDSMENAWAVLRRHGDVIRKRTLNDLFAADSRRFERFSLQLDDLLVDYSKNLVTTETMALLQDAADVADLTRRRDAMLAGAPVNASEYRAALHTALRAPRSTVITVNGRNVIPDVHNELDRALAFAETVRSGTETLRDIVHIGAGGSVLGPATITDALAPYHHDRINVHFVSNADGADIHDKLRKLNPETTLFVIASKSFSTPETMLNAASARKWITDALGNAAIGDHFAAIAMDMAAVAEFGIRPDRTFRIWNWVGGRFSVWSAIGLPAAIACGAGRFRELLAGAHRMDRHFATAPIGENLPMVLGLVKIWCRSILGYATSAIIPYDQRLARMVQHLQQVDLESNGKSVRADGTSVAVPTAGVVWGGTGTSVQHSFFQLLHQGSDIIPCEFLVAATAHEGRSDHHDMLLANCLAQSQTLMTGRDIADTVSMLMEQGMERDQAERLAPHRAFPGNRPSTTLLYRQLDPYMLGMLLALYEHTTFVQGTLWGVNSFDQWGVELGKECAGQILSVLQDKNTPTENSSTRGLLDTLRHFTENDGDRHRAM